VDLALKEGLPLQQLTMTEKMHTEQMMTEWMRKALKQNPSEAPRLKKPARLNPRELKTAKN
jgi:hypothetical protein